MAHCSNCFASLVLVEHSSQWQPENKSYQISLKSLSIILLPLIQFAESKREEKAIIPPNLTPLSLRQYFGNPKHKYNTKET